MISRRDFLKGAGSLVVSFSLFPERQAGAQGFSPLPGRTGSNARLDAWIRISTDGLVSIYPGRVELGQGIVTALGQIAAEELRVDFKRIRMEPVDTDHSPNEGITAGSMSIEQGGSAMRAAAAEAHQVLVGMAAQELDADADLIAVQDGNFFVNGRPAGLDYWRLLGGREFNAVISGTGVSVPPDQHRIVGTSVPRLDVPAKVYGEASFIHDIRLPRMLHARVVRPPVPGARLVSVDTGATAIPGVKQIIRDGSFLAVAAEREEQAMAGAEKLKALCRWSSGQVLPGMDNMAAWLRAAAADAEVIAERGSPGSGNTEMIAAEYYRPYQAHASISPSLALALMEGGKLTVWSHAQGMYPLRDALAAVTRLDPGAIRCIHAPGCGCYGHNGADDAACDAAIVALHMPGTAIRLQYSREDEFRWEPYGSAMAMRAEAALDSRGMIDHWHYHVWSCTHSTRPRGGDSAGNLVSAGLIRNALKVPAPGNIPQPNGGGDRNAIPLYRFPNLQVSNHFIPDMPIRVSALRGLGAYANVFAIESFMDELAQRVNRDPIDFRIDHLDDQRAVILLKQVRKASGWDGPRDQYTGRGIGFARYKNRSAYCAVVAYATVDRNTGTIRLPRAFAVVDAGMAINPDGLINQIEGGIIQSASWTLQEQVKFLPEQLLANDWESYPVLGFSGSPDVTVEIINRPDQPSLGAGEASQGPAAAAIANAVADAAGIRLREIPFTGARVLTALRQRA